MPTKSIRPTVNTDESGDHHNQKLIEDAQAAFTESYGRMVATLKEVLDDIERPHLLAGKPVLALLAVNSFLSMFGNFLEDNTSRFVEGFGPNGQLGSQPSPSVDTQRLAELESQSERAQRVLATAERANELESQLSDANTENTRLQRELAASQAEVQEFRDAATLPNPLSERNRQLEGQVNDLTAQLATATADNERLTAQLAAAQAPALPVAEPAQPDPAPVVEPAADPDDQSGQQPTGMIGGIQGQPTPEPKKGFLARAADAFRAPPSAT